MPGQTAKTARLNVALHAQSKFVRHGFVAGSEITTSGMARALTKVEGIGKVAVFAPFAYEDLEKERLGKLGMSTGALFQAFLLVHDADGTLSLLKGLPVLSPSLLRLSGVEIHL
jgi:hypothetical protein